MIAQVVQARDLQDGDVILVLHRDGANVPRSREIVHVQEDRIDGMIEIWFSSLGKYDGDEEFKFWHSPDDSIERHAAVVVLR